MTEAARAACIYRDYHKGGDAKAATETAATAADSAQRIPKLPSPPSRATPHRHSPFHSNMNAAIFTSKILEEATAIEDISIAAKLPSTSMAGNRAIKKCPQNLEKEKKMGVLRSAATLGSLNPIDQVPTGISVVELASHQVGDAAADPTSEESCADEIKKQGGISGLKYVPTSAEDLEEKPVKSQEPRRAAPDGKGAASVAWQNGVMEEDLERNGALAGGRRVDYCLQVMQQ